MIFNSILNCTYFLVETPGSEGYSATNSTKGKGLTISAPCRGYNLLLELLLWDFLAARDVQSEVRSTSAEKLVSYGIKSQG